MMIVKSEAIVLKTMKYRGTSVIATFYTRQFGKISGIVKGARQPKNKFGSALQPMAHVLLVLYKKDGRDLQMVTQCDTLTVYRGLSEDIERMAVGMSMVELTANIAHEEEENPELFGLLQSSLSAVNVATKNPPNLLYYFELKLAELLGFQPRFNDCISCRKPVLRGSNTGDQLVYHLGRGGPLCAGCASVPGQVRKMTIRNLLVLKALSERTNLDEVVDLETDFRAKEEINGFLWDYLRQHISGMKTLKSSRVFARIFDAS